MTLKVDSLDMLEREPRRGRRFPLPDFERNNNPTVNGKSS